MTRPTALILDYGEVLSHPMRPGAMSLMPPGFDLMLSKQELADLIAFLKAAR